MYKGGSRLLPLALVVIVTIVAIIAMVAVGRALLGRNGSNTEVDNSAAKSLLVAEADRSVRMTVRGPIIADEEFNSYQIEVGAAGRRLTTYKGYGEQIIDTEQLANSMRGYEEFVYALDRVGFTSERKLEETLDDVRGICASGRLYTFEILQAQSVIKQLWVASCRDARGSFGGNAPEARDLFLKQIPDSTTRLRGLNL